MFAFSGELAAGKVKTRGPFTPSGAACTSAADAGSAAMNVHQRRVDDVVDAGHRELRSWLIEDAETAAARGRRHRRHLIRATQVEDERLRGGGHGENEDSRGCEHCVHWFQK